MVLRVVTVPRLTPPRSDAADSLHRSRGVRSGAAGGGTSGRQPQSYWVAEPSLFGRLDTSISLEHTQVQVTPAATYLRMRVDS